MSSDEELLASWRAGDERSGSELFRLHFRTVRLYFSNKVSDPAELEELTQATFVACVEARERFEGRANFKTYLLAIARNLLYARWRARARTRVENIEDMSLADLGAGPSSVLAHHEGEKRLLRALRQIPLRDQEALEGYYWQELSGPELAGLLGLSEDGARSRLRRAKQTLRRELNRLERFGGAPESTEEDLEGWALRVRRQVV